MKKDIVLFEAVNSTSETFDPRIRVEKVGHKVRVYVVNGGDRWDSESGLIIGYLDHVGARDLHTQLGEALTQCASE